MTKKGKSKPKRRRSLRRAARRAAGAVKHHIIPEAFMGVGLARIPLTRPSNAGGVGGQSVVQVILDKNQDWGSKLENALSAAGEMLLSPAVYAPILIGAGAAYAGKKFKLGTYTKIDKKTSVL